MEDRLLCTHFTLLHCFSLGTRLFKYARTTGWGKSPTCNLEIYTRE